jgi:hypothetical protein
LNPAETLSLQDPVELRRARIAESCARKDSNNSSLSVTDFWLRPSYIDCLYVMYKLKTKAKKHSISRTSSLTTMSSETQQIVIKIEKIIKFVNLPIKNYRNQQQLTKK